MPATCTLLLFQIVGLYQVDWPARPFYTGPLDVFPFFVSPSLKFGPQTWLADYASRE